MTGPRPGGTTSRGLPYPGSTGIIANTPSALQALAEAITGQLSSLGSGIITDAYAGNANASAGKIDLSNIALYFPKLASVTGMVGGLGGSPAAYFLCGSGASVYVSGMNYRAAQINGAVWIDVLAWGPPK